MIKPTIKGYEVLDTVGNGAGSIVYRAMDIARQRLVAIKHVTRKTVAAIEKARRSGRTGNGRVGTHARLPYDSFFAQVRNEHRVLRTLDRNSYSPHILKVYDLITVRRFFRISGYDLVTEFIDGHSLREKRDYPMIELIRYFRQAASALAYLHAHKILHADMKPHHVFIAADGTAKLIDFGQARFFADPPGRIQGTVDFMAPEQAKGKPVDARTDVYGLGATMYWALTGQANRPALSGMGGGVGFTVGYAGRADSVREKNPDCPPALDTLVIACCERRPEKRPKSMAEVMARLDAILKAAPAEDA
ncbi:MAG: serine/threonine protein kinase [Planctomycetota bacterium]